MPFTKWCILRYPNASMAQMANMSTEGFEDFYFNVCNLDYKETLQSHGTFGGVDGSNGPGTDHRQGDGPYLSIKGLPAIKCDGHRNIPDGEVFTAPVRESVNGGNYL